MDLIAGLEGIGIVGGQGHIGSLNQHGTAIGHGLIGVDDEVVHDLGDLTVVYIGRQQSFVNTERAANVDPRRANCADSRTRSPMLVVCFRGSPPLEKVSNCWVRSLARTAAFPSRPLRVTPDCRVAHPTWPAIDCRRCRLKNY